jgi:hypothetical protein
MAILQFEISRAAASDDPASFLGEDKTRSLRLRSLLYDALKDTLKNGGTFTVVVGKTHITAVQLEDAVELDDAP